MKKLLFILGLLLAAPAWATQALVQHPKITTCTGNSSNTTCALTLSQTTTAGNAGVFVVSFGGSNGASSVIASINTGGTLTLCAASGCHGTDSTNIGIDMAYVLSLTAVSAITITVSPAPASNWTFEFIEYSPTSGDTFSLDTFGVRDQTTGVTNPAGVALTPSGSNDVIVQSIHSAGTVSAISGSYTNPADFSTAFGAAGLINTSSGTAPTWTTTSGKAGLAALALKEIASASPTGSQLVGPSALAGPAVVH